MFKILPFIIGFFLINTKKEVINHSVVYASDNPAERIVWEHLRLVDPNTGEIPKNIRKKEMIFAKTLPKSTRINKTNWLHRGPYNVGGRTRALAFDVLDENTILVKGSIPGHDGSNVIIKPTRKKYTLKEIIPLFKIYKNINYFAVSNVETDTDLDEFLNSIPKNIIIVPKIESPKGVKNIEKIVKKLDHEEKIVMLDHDDLFSNIKKENEDPSNFQKYIKLLIEKCKENNVNLLRTVGVVFSDDEKRETQYVK